MDERIADGFYFSKTLRLWNQILANPECLLEKQISKTVLKKPKKKKKISWEEKKKANKIKRLQAKEERKIKKGEKKK